MSWAFICQICGVELKPKGTGVVLERCEGDQHMGDLFECPSCGSGVHHVNRTPCVASFEPEKKLFSDTQISFIGDTDYPF